MDTTRWKLAARMGAIVLLTCAVAFALWTPMLDGISGSFILGSGNIFPTLDGRSSAGARAGDPAARACAPALTIPPEWRRHRASGTSSRLRDLTVQLPPTFADDTSGGHADGAGDYWGHIMGSWTVPRPEARTPPWEAGHVAFWIGPDEGYPTYGRGDARQVAITECHFDGPAGTAYLVSYELETSDGREFVVSSYWPITKDAWLQGTASVYDAAEVPAMIAAMRSVSFAPGP
jgi:hypothetical protein